MTDLTNLKRFLFIYSCGEGLQLTQIRSLPGQWHMAPSYAGHSSVFDSAWLPLLCLLNPHIVSKMEKERMMQGGLS